MDNELLNETLITMTTACKAFPMGHVSRSCLERWIRKGVRNGARLETVCIGWKRYTTQEAIERFISSMNAEGQQLKPIIKRPTKDLEERRKKLGI